jgi:hypothetical protein
MDPSEIRRRVRQILDKERHQAAAHREHAQRTSQAFDNVLPGAAAMWKQVASVLKAEGHGFSVHTPAGVLRLVSDRSPDDFIEVTVDAARRPSAVVVRTRLTRGSVLIDRESVVVEGGAVHTLGEDRLLDVLLEELGPFVER